MTRQARDIFSAEAEGQPEFRRRSVPALPKTPDGPRDLSLTTAVDTTLHAVTRHANSTKGANQVPLTFKPLWRLLIDRDMTKEDLRVATGLSAATIAKMGKNGNVTTDILDRVCSALDCDIKDILESTDD